MSQTKGKSENHLFMADNATLHTIRLKVCGRGPKHELHF